MQLLRLLLTLLEFIEFLTTPIGVTTWVWLGIYTVLISTCALNLTLATVLILVPALYCYTLLQQVRD